VTHVDYSARIQTVHPATNPRYYALLQKFYERTGCPVIVNTSFNVRGEPIVCTPEDAFHCFMARIWKPWLPETVSCARANRMRPGAAVPVEIRTGLVAPAILSPVFFLVQTPRRQDPRRYKLLDAVLYIVSYIYEL